MIGMTGPYRLTRFALYRVDLVSGIISSQTGSISVHAPVNSLGVTPPWRQPPLAAPRPLASVTRRSGPGATASPKRDISLPMKNYSTTVLADGFVFLEGPRWHDGRLWVSDMRAQTVYTVEESGARSPVVEVPHWPSGLGFLPDGTPLVVSMQDRLLYKVVEGELVLHADLSELVAAHINDMVVDDQGRAYIGNLGYDIFGGADPDTAEITLVETDGSVRHVARERDCPNGMVIRQDGRTLVAAESFAHRVTEFDRAPNGDLSNPRVLAELPDEVPDGICLDRAENVWVSAAMGKRFVQVAPSGDIIGVVDVSPRLAIACQLGGADGRTLFCLTYGGEMEDVFQGKAAARIDIAHVDIAGAGSP